MRYSVGMNSKDYAKNLLETSNLPLFDKDYYKSLGTDAKRFITMAIEDLDFDDEYAYQYYYYLLEEYDIE